MAGVRRRVILATNVAETSLTVPGIKYVIDTAPRASPATATAPRCSDCRSRRCHRPRRTSDPAAPAAHSDGIAIRLYSEEDYDRRPEYTEPEILRTSLASVILQMLSLGFGDITAFPFLTPPDSRGVKAAFDLLTELGAVEPSRRDGSPHLTRIGRDIARMPIDPRFARMLIEAGRGGSAGTVTRDVLAIVSGMTIQDVRERPEERREEPTACTPGSSTRPVTSLPC